MGNVLENELIARVLFPPQMVMEGKVLPAAFVLRSLIGEEYISVLRISVSTFNSDVKTLLYSRQRSFYGYAVMRVDDIHCIKCLEDGHTANCIVKEVDNHKLKSHAGIFMYVDGMQIVGNTSFEQLPDGKVQSHLLLALRFQLTQIANRGLIEL